MTTEASEIIAAFKADVEDAISFIDSDISPARAIATRLYDAEPFGDEEEGRSQIVTPTVREVVRATLPSLMRVFFGGMRVVQFEGTNETSAEYADEMTESVEHIFMRQNPGFEIAWDAFKDALVRKVGWVSWHWDDSTEIKSRLFSGVTIEQLAEMDAELGDGEKLEVIEGKEEEGQPQVDPMTGQPMPPAVTYKVRLIQKKSKKKVGVESVPPEEIFISRDAKSPYSCKLVGRRSLKTKGELRGMGISEELIDEAGGGYSGLTTNHERLARSMSAFHGEPAHATEDQKSVLYVDAFYRVDSDEDGISELRHICTLGDNFVEVHNEYADDVRLAAFCPDPEPHTVWGLSQADNVGDLQIINSHVLRDWLDGTKASIFPRSIVLEGQANMDDVLNTEIGAAIRVRSVGAVTFAQPAFQGATMVMPLLEHLEGQKEARTGLSRNAAGLDPRALQSTNQVAVAATVTASQAQVELIARIFAETGMRRLFRGIIKTLVENHRGQFSVPIRGKFQNVNPMKWDVDAELKVDTGLGVGSNDQKLNTLSNVAAGQVQALTTLGMDNPLCSLNELYHTNKTILQLSGFRDVHRFWKDPALSDETLEEQQPEPTPEQVLAEAQMKIEAGKLDLNTLEAVLEDDRERDKIESDVMLRATEISAKYGTAVDVAAIKAAMDRKRIDAAALKAKTAA